MTTESSARWSRAASGGGSGHSAEYARWRWAIGLWVVSFSPIFLDSKSRRNIVRISAASVSPHRRTRTANAGINRR